MVLRTFIVIILPLMLSLAGLSALLVALRNLAKTAESRSRLTKLFAGLCLILLVSYVARISFFNDSMDALVRLGFIVLGPVILVYTLEYKGSATRVLALLLTSVAAVMTCFIAFLIFLFATPLLERVETDGDQTIKVYELGGATADCNYEIRRTVQKFWLAEREISAEKFSTTPELPGCS